MHITAEQVPALAEIFTFLGVHLAELGGGGNHLSDMTVIRMDCGEAEQSEPWKAVCVAGKDTTANYLISVLPLWWMPMRGLEISADKLPRAHHLQTQRIIPSGLQENAVITTSRIPLHETFGFRTGARAQFCFRSPDSANVIDQESLKFQPPAILQMPRIKQKPSRMNLVLNFCIIM